MRKIFIITFLLSAFFGHSQMSNGIGIANFISGSSPATPLIVDSLTSATVQTIHSLRKTRASYSGNCLQVKRSSDNTTQDFGFVNNFLDTAGIKTFVGANDGTVTIWYDQSGNGRNLTPGSGEGYIVQSGVITRYDDSVAVYTYQNNYQTSNYTAYPDSATFVFIMKVSTNSSYNAGLTKSSSSVAYPMDWWTSNIYTGNGSSYSNVNISPDGLDQSIALTSFMYKGTPSAVYFRKHTGYTTGASSPGYGDASNKLYWGTRGDLVTSFIGYLFEAITFSSIDDNDIDKLQDNQTIFYGL